MTAPMGAYETRLRAALLAHTGKPWTTLGFDAVEGEECGKVLIGSPRADFLGVLPDQDCRILVLALLLGPTVPVKTGVWIPGELAAREEVINRLERKPPAYRINWL